MTEVEPDREAVAACWAEFCAATGTTGEPADVYGFGDSAEIAGRLARLVLDGTKRATAGALVDYADEGRIPEVGDHQVIVDGSGSPVAVVRTTEVRVGWLSSVDEAFAWDEGEGDRTRDWWVAAHLGFFARTYAAAGRELDLDPELVFERFTLVWPRETRGA